MELTGTGTKIKTNFEDIICEIRKFTDVPVALGFRIKYSRTI